MSRVSGTVVEVVLSLAQLVKHLITTNKKLLVASSCLTCGHYLRNKRRGPDYLYDELTHVKDAVADQRDRLLSVFEWMAIGRRVFHGSCLLLDQLCKQPFQGEARNHVSTLFLKPALPPS